MKIFFDTEFTGLHKNTTLISVGLIADNEESFYAEFADYDSSQVNEWIRENVVSKLFLNPYGDNPFLKIWNNETYAYGNKEAIKKFISKWLSQFDEIEMWSDCLSYDWVLFCDIFGGAFNIPKNIYYIPFDISTLFKEKGIDPDVNREKFGFGEYLQEMKVQKHNSLWDARMIRACYNKLNSGNNHNL